MAKPTHLKKLKGSKQLACFLFPPENLEPLKCWREERFLIRLTGHLDNGSGQSTANELRVTLYRRKQSSLDKLAANDESVKH